MAARTHVLVAGWFSFEEGHATAGDLLVRDLVASWLQELGCEVTLAVAPPFTGGINWRLVDPEAVDRVLFVCGPFQNGALEQDFLARFATRSIVGINLSMVESLGRFNPFEALLERDSDRDTRPDLAFMTKQDLTPVIGVCLVEDYPNARTQDAHAAVRRLIDRHRVAVVEIDTRLDQNAVGLRTPAEIESMIARVDALVTTRLHGLVLALKNGVPVVAIDPEPGGFKIRKQAATIQWPKAFVVDEMTDAELDEALAWCLTSDARQHARLAAHRALKLLTITKADFWRLMEERTT